MSSENSLDSPKFQSVGSFFFATYFFNNILSMWYVMKAYVLTSSGMPAAGSRHKACASSPAALRKPVSTQQTQE